MVEIDSVSSGLIRSGIERINDGVHFRFFGFNLRIGFKSSVNSLQPGYIVGWQGLVLDDKGFQ